MRSEGVTEQPLDSPEFIYGWGRTKHIAAAPVTSHGYTYRIALCGARGGNNPDPKRPVCKTCLRAAGDSYVDPRDAQIAALLAECEARTKEVEELRESRRALAMENVALAAKLQTLRHAIEFRYEQEERNRGAAS